MVTDRRLLEGVLFRALSVTISSTTYASASPERRKWHDQCRPAQGGAQTAVTHWQGLSEFLNDGRVEMDTNTVEREIRPVAVTRKAALFAGSEAGGENWAVATTLIRTAILNGVDPQAWLTDALEQMVSGKVNNRSLASLLPWAWRDAKRDAVAA
jgi:hypothetical protein